MFIGRLWRQFHWPNDENAVRINVDMLAGKYHGRRTELLDNSRPVDPAA